MIRNVLLLLVLLICIENSLYAQGEIYGNAFWQSANNRIVIRLALRNKTGSSSGQMQFVGMRFGVQFNNAKVTYAGYQSYMPGLSAPDYFSTIGPDTDPAAANIGVESTPSRSAAIGSTGQNKILQCRYINLSTNVCTNAVSIPQGTSAVMIDIFFTLVSPAQPSDYHLNDPNYGFGDSEFIAQFFTKDNGGLNGVLTDAYKEIAIVIIRQGQLPYQPFDASNCTNQNFSPIALSNADINFVNPINGILPGTVSNMKLEKKADDVAVNWEANNNDLVDHYEIERKQGNGIFKMVGMVMSDNSQKRIQLEYKDKNVPGNENLYYRIKILGTDNAVTYSDIKLIRPENAQSNTIVMYPNPAKDFVNMRLVNATGNYIYKVYSSDGRVIMNGSVTSSNPQINTSQLKAGSYFVDLYHPQSGIRYSSQFKKQ